jgi:hypothetical protein
MIDEGEDISRGDQLVLGATCAGVVGNSGELPSVVELIVRTLSEGGG